MARRTNTEELIHCDSCGEDYSATYKRCPFCGGKYDTRPIQQAADDDDDDGYVFDGQDLFEDKAEDTRVVSPKGGKRLSGTATAARRAAPKSRAGGQPPINWPRLITFLCSLVIIVAALVIIFTVVYPQLHNDPAPNSSSAQQAGSSAQPSQLPSQEPSGTADDDPSVSGAPSVAPATVTSLTLDTYDFTLWPGQFNTLKLAIEPADWTGDVTWTSSDENYATVDANGTVTNVNTTTSLRRVTITVTAGGRSAECTVYCRGTETSESAPPVVTSPDPVQSQSPSGGSLTVGAKGTITGADGGLRVRSGPGTSYEVLASLVNGNAVTILADAGNGWYQISYSGAGGADATGYIMGEYISVP